MLQVGPPALIPANAENAAVSYLSPKQDSALAVRSLSYPVPSNFPAQVVPKNPARFHPPGLATSLGCIVLFVWVLFGPTKGLLSDFWLLLYIFNPIGPSVSTNIVVPRCSCSFIVSYTSKIPQNDLGIHSGIHSFATSRATLNVFTTVPGRVRKGL